MIKLATRHGGSSIGFAGECFAAGYLNLRGHRTEFTAPTASFDLACLHAVTGLIRVQVKTGTSDYWYISDAQTIKATADVLCIVNVTAQAIGFVPTQLIRPDLSSYRVKTRDLAPLFDTGRDVLSEALRNALEQPLYAVQRVVSYHPTREQR